MKRIKFTKKHVIWAILFALLAVFLYDGNNRLTVTEYSLNSSALPDSFDGVRIVQLSDLHNKVFGKDDKPLLDRVRALEPDLILLTGDIIDGKTHTNVEKALVFMRQIADIAPTYYVYGNHEHALKKSVRDAFIEEITAHGVQFLNNESTQIESDTGETLTVIGLDDLSLQSPKLQELVDDAADDFFLVLAHEPQFLPDYADSGVQFVFTGHAHGGQFRIPFTHQGIYAPDQGFFPKMTEGVFYDRNTAMIVNRGLGNSAFPFRVFNRPEIVLVTLHGGIGEHQREILGLP